MGAGVRVGAAYGPGHGEFHPGLAEVLGADRAWFGLGWAVVGDGHTVKPLLSEVGGVGFRVMQSALHRSDLPMYRVPLTWGGSFEAVRRCERRAILLLSSGGFPPFCHGISLPDRARVRLGRLVCG